MKIYGHVRALTELERELPPVTLLLGPRSIGKRTLAEHLVRHHHVPDAEVQYLLLTADRARGVLRFCEIAPMSGVLKVLVLNLETASEQAQNILLKVLEEPPPAVRFLLVSSRAPLSTIMSRARVYKLGLLTDSEVLAILLERGVDPDDALYAAACGRGRVAPALSALQETEEGRVRSLVAAAVRAARDRNDSIMDTVMRNWSDVHTQWLRAWAAEAASGRWVVFGAGFVTGVTKVQARKVLEVLSGYGGARMAAAIALHQAFPKEGLGK